MANRNVAPVPPVKNLMDDIGGAIVRRRFTLGGREVTSGTVLTAGEIKAIPGSNRRALIDNHYFSPFPRAVKTHLEAQDSTEPPIFHLVNLGFGKWDVVEGKRINNRPLSKDEAESLIDQKGAKAELRSMSHEDRIKAGVSPLPTESKTMEGIE